MADMGTELKPWEIAAQREGQMQRQDLEAAREMEDMYSPQKLRTFLQGITYNTADEAEAALRSFMTGRPYPEVIGEIRDQIKNYQETSPGAAITSELLGGIGSTGAVMLATRGKGAPAAGTSAQATGTAFQTFFPNLAKALGYGALEATAAGIGSAEGNLVERLDPYRMGLQAGTGGIVSAGLFWGGNALGKIGSFGVDILRNLSMRRGPDAINMEIQRIAQDAGVTPEVAAGMLLRGEALANDPNIARDLAGYRASHPKVAEQIDSAFGRVREDQMQAFDVVSSGLGAGMDRNVYDIARRSMETVQANTNKLYRESGADQVIAPDDVLESMQEVILRFPGGGKKLQDAFRSKYGKTFFNVDKDGNIEFSSDPTMMDAEYLRRVINDEGNALIDKGGADAAIGINLVDAEAPLRESIDNAMPRLGEVRSQAATNYQIKEAYEAGKRLKDPEEFSSVYDEIVESGNPDAMQSFRLGYLQSLRSRMTGQNKTTLTNRLLDEDSKEGILLRAVFPESQLDDALERLGVSQRTQQSFATMRAGSQTADKQQAVARQGSLSGVAQVVSDLGSAQYGNPQAVANIFERMMRTFSPQITSSQAAEVAKVLLSKDPEFVTNALRNRTALRQVQDVIAQVTQTPLRIVAQGSAQTFSPEPEGQPR